YYTEDHEWLRRDSGVVTIGITDHAQSQLGDIVFFEPPSIGQRLEKGEKAAVVESVKAASEIYAPLSGVVIEINDAVVGDPSLINKEAQSSAWMFKVSMSDETELTGLLNEPAYLQLIA
ncbi:MAG: glycine cleavage system protein GcvH, partial [Fimbriimonadaceae bacterium]|nr:glycine cleavage system protein GcvH [Alphaproteobacteria bacterium]